MLTDFLGLRLNTAGIIIGWVGGVASFFYMVVESLAFGYLDEISKAIIDQSQNANLTQEAVRQFLIIALSIHLAVNTINLCASSLLIAGTIKERHLLLVPWLLNTGLATFVEGVQIVYLLIVFLATSAPFDSFLYVILLGIHLAIQSYIWYGIHSLYKQIQATRDMQQRLLPSGSSASYPSYTKT